jgi:glucan 1,3-beta-glucosidase
MSPAELVKCINSVKSLLQGIGLGSIKVGTADSWNLWINGANVDVVRAADIVLANAFSVPTPILDIVNGVLARSRY